jgi:hypothetical protein
MAERLPHRESYLDEMLRHDGLGDDIDLTCTGCRRGDAVFKCSDCLFSRLYCSFCMVEQHRGNPLHRIFVSFAVLFTTRYLIMFNSVGMAISLKTLP